MCKKCGFAGVLCVGVERKTLFLSIVWTKKKPVDIAEITGKKHNHVMRDIQSMMTALGLDESNFGSIYQDAMGRNKPYFRRKKAHDHYQ